MEKETFLQAIWKKSVYLHKQQKYEIKFSKKPADALPLSAQRIIPIGALSYSFLIAGFHRRKFKISSLTFKDNCLLSFYKR